MARKTIVVSFNREELSALHSLYSLAWGDRDKTARKLEVAIQRLDDRKAEEERSVSE